MTSVASKILNYCKIPLYSLEDCIEDPSKAKLPAIKKNVGFKAASSKTMKLDVFNTNKILHMNYTNYGILTGGINKLVVIDLDTNKSKWEDSDHMFYKWGQKTYGVTDLDSIVKNINTFTVKTQSGGYHLYFTSDRAEGYKGIKVKQIEIDIQARGNYVVGFGSRFSETSSYEVYMDTDIRKLDEVHDLVDEIYVIHEGNKPNKPHTRQIELRNRTPDCQNTTAFNYVFKSEEIFEILGEIPLEYFESLDKWLVFTTFCKTIGSSEMFHSSEFYRSLWRRGSKKSTRHNLDDIQIQSNNEKMYDNAKTNHGAVINIFKAIGRIKDLVNYCYKPILEDSKKPDKIETLDKLPFTYIDTDENLVIRSDTGTGKTTITCHYLFGDTSNRFLSIVSRISLAEEQCKNFNKFCNEKYEHEERIGLTTYLYKDIPKYEFHMYEGDNLVIQLESIINCEQWDFSEYIVFMDEFNSIIEHLLSSDTLQKNRKRVFKLFCKIIQTCKQIVCVDADISDLCFKLLDGLDIDYEFRVNDYKHNKNVISQELHDPDSFCERLQQYDEFLVCFDSKSEAERIREHMNDDSIIIYDSEYTKQIKMHKPKIFITPKVIYGLDSKLTRPVFAYFTENTISPKSMLQQIARERDITMLYYCFPDKNNVGKHFNYTFDTIEDVSTRIDLYDARFKGNYISDCVNFDVFEDICKHNTSDLYFTLLKHYLFNTDAYSGNKHLHFKLLLDQRGFEVQWYSAFRSKSLSKEEIKLYDETVYEEKKKKFSVKIVKSGRNIIVNDNWKQETKAIFKNRLHQELNDILKIPHKILQTPTVEIPDYILDMFLIPARVTQHFNIVKLFVLDLDELKQQHVSVAKDEYFYNLVNSDKGKITWVRSVMDECEVLENSLNASKAYSTEDAKTKYLEYTKLFNYYAKKAADFTNTKIISEYLYKAVKQILKFKKQDEDLMPVVIQKKRVRVDGVQKSQKSYDILSLKEHKRLHEFRNSKYINYIR